MATIYTCDKCDTSSKTRKDIHSVEVPTLAPYQHEVETKHMDLCNNCLRKLADWTKPDPKVMEGKEQ